MWVALASFLISIVGTLAGRVLLSVGIGMVSYAALNTLVEGVISNVTSNYQSVGGVVLQFLNLAGAGQAIGILSAALVTRTALVAIKKLRAI